MASDHSAAQKLPTLYEEHLRLGASFNADAVPDHYANQGEVAQGTQGAILSDVSDMCLLLFSGSPSSSFAQTAFAGESLSQFECAFEAVLTGDGSIASIPLLMRTGNREYLVADVSQRGEVLEAWLSFLSAINQNGQAPFEGLETDDVRGTHVVLAMTGAKATSVLSDYLKVSKARLPMPGQVTQCNLDAIPCIIACQKVGKHPLYVVLVPPMHAVALWRSLLSFPEVVPYGRADLCRYLSESLDWFSQLRSGDTIRLGADSLMQEGLMRTDRNFVGARGLADNSQKGGGVS